MAERYELGVHIGQGGFGTVYMANVRGTKEVVAIKVVFYRNGVTRQNALREIETLQKLKHQYILGIKNTFEFSNQQGAGVAIVTEYCSNGSLLNVLEKNPYGFAQNKRLEIFIQLMDALSYMHSSRIKIIHRDIKPENILMDGQFNVKIADVGLAKILDTDNMQGIDMAAIYMQTTAGTVSYMAPEVFQKHYTMSSDIFSMGLVMYVMCELPPGLIPQVVVHTHQNIGQYYKAILMPPLDLLGAKNCVDYERKIINKMLQPDHHNRPQASEILEEVQDEWKRLHKQQQQLQAQQQQLQAQQPRLPSQPQSLQGQFKQLQAQQQQLQAQQPRLPSQPQSLQGQFKQLHAQQQQLQAQQPRLPSQPQSLQGQWQSLSAQWPH